MHQEGRKGGPYSGVPGPRERAAGCLLGGAVGDALGAPVEFLRLSEIRERFGPGGLTDFAEAYGQVGAITDDTQMTLFTAEGLLRAVCRERHTETCDRPAVLHGAYLRWLKTQGFASEAESFHASTKDDGNGWLLGVKELHARRGPGTTCLSALMAPRLGRVAGPAVNDSKGCGGVMRAAPAGILGESVEGAFELGCETAAITHGHPTGWLAGGALAAIVRALLDGRSLRESVREALRMLETDARSSECRDALAAAASLAGRGRPTAEKLSTLGDGWVAEEALAIGVYAALVAGTFRDGVVLAVNHGGDSDSTGAIAGNILGAALGRDAIPFMWLARLELREVIEQVAEDLVTRYEDGDAWWKRYPGF
ncbi:MAG TPA: ADP-ribosylglycohydrolase family protein [Thermoanaerobaculia bacterium]|nr:ADP-ribosylglycohydrolase family protein [Thermoanaerobaculia bacterium]